jgi:hypothetical protein
MAANGVDGRFAKNDFGGTRVARPEVSGVPASSLGETSPNSRSCATDLGADGSMGLASDHDEDRVGSSVGVDDSRLDQRFDDVERKTSLLGEIEGGC